MFAVRPGLIHIENMVTFVRRSFSAFPTVTCGGEKTQQNVKHKKSINHMIDAYFSP
jgi:hypothetical protein